MTTERKTGYNSRNCCTTSFKMLELNFFFALDFHEKIKCFLDFFLCRRFQIASVIWQREGKSINDLN